MTREYIGKECKEGSVAPDIHLAESIISAGPIDETKTIRYIPSSTALIIRAMGRYAD
jgi:hypothetical protein